MKEKKEFLSSKISAFSIYLMFFIQNIEFAVFTDLSDCF